MAVSTGSCCRTDQLCFSLEDMGIYDWHRVPPSVRLGSGHGSGIGQVYSNPGTSGQQQPTATKLVCKVMMGRRPDMLAAQSQNYPQRRSWQGCSLPGRELLHRLKKWCGKIAGEWANPAQEPMPLFAAKVCGNVRDRLPGETDTPKNMQWIMDPQKRRSSAG